MKKVIVTGSRSYPNWKAIADVLTELDPDLVIQGGASGADQAAAGWAERHYRDTHTMRARWKTSAGYQNSAGIVRNQRMLEAYPGVLVIAFPFGIANGTRHCMHTALQLGHPLKVYGPDGELLREYDGT